MTGFQEGVYPKRSQFLSGGYEVHIDLSQNKTEIENKKDSWRARGVRSKPKLTEENLEEFLNATLRSPVRYSKLPTLGAWLVFRLIIEHGFRTGEIVGMKKKKDRPGIHLSDLREDSIWVHTLHPGDKRFAFHQGPLGKKDYLPASVSTDLLREIHKYAEKNQLKNKLFNVSESHVRKLSHKFARMAGIPEYDLVNPENLRDGFEEYGSSLDLGALNAKMLRRAKRMSQYYTATFCIERELRELVSQRMSKKYGPKWWEEKVDGPIQSKVKERQDQEFGTLMFERSKDPLEYTNFTELIEILAKYWDVFKDNFSRVLTV